MVAMMGKIEVAEAWIVIRVDWWVRVGVWLR